MFLSYFILFIVVLYTYFICRLFVNITEGVLKYSTMDSTDSRDILVQGTRFDSYNEVVSYIKTIEKKLLISLYKRDSKKLQTISKNCPKKCQQAKAELIYYLLEYTCHQGGKRFKSYSKGIRKASTFKNNCPMKLKFTLSCDGQALVLSEVKHEHNHTITEESFNFIPKQRVLSDEEKKEVIKLKNLKCNKILLKSYIEEKTGKKVQLRDITNIKDCKSENDLEEVVKIFQEDPEAVLQLLVDENQILQGIYFQDNYMKESFANYPSVILMDATYKMNNLRMPLYILMSVNGNNEGAVVGTFFLQNENAESISEMLRIFKNHNPQWTLITTIFTDKDFTEQKTLKREFPQCKLCLCLFHTLKSFRTNITVQAMGINSDQKDVVLEILQNLAYSKNSATYEKNYDALIKLNLPLVSKYFNENWHNCKEQWVQCFKKEHGTYGISTTNHLESFNKRIKSACSKYSTLQQFYKEFLILLKSIHTERQRQCIEMSTKIPSNITLGTIEYKYFQYVTVFAYELLKKNLVQAEKVIFSSEQNEHYAEITVTDIIIRVTSSDCQCLFFKDMKLPCKHIFKFREKKNMDLFDEELIPLRFRKSNYLQNYGIHKSSEEPTIHIQEDIIMSIPNKGIQTINKLRVLSQQEKYKIAINQCQQIATILSEMNTERFNASLPILKDLALMWNDHKKVIIVEEEITSQNFNNFHVEPMDLETHLEMDAQQNTFSIEDKNKNVTNNLSDTNQSENITDLPDNEIMFNVESNSFCDKNQSENTTDLPDKEISNVEVGKSFCEENINERITCLPDKEIISSVEVGNSFSDKNRNLHSITTNDIKMPLKMKRRGRPKGINLTAIGLSKNRKCLPFLRQIPRAKKEKILHAILLDKKVVREVLYENKIIEATEIPSPSSINCFVFEKEVNLAIIEKCFTPEAFNTLKRNVKIRGKNTKWFCKVCEQVVDTNSVRCDSCLHWFHVQCTSLLKLPKTNSLWFCLSCKKIS